MKDTVPRLTIVRLDYARIAYTLVVHCGYFSTTCYHLFQIRELYPKNSGLYFIDTAVYSRQNMAVFFLCPII